MEAEDPLSQLADIHLPESVAFWPPAPGWWFLAACILLLVFLLVGWLYRQWMLRRRLSSALQELDTAWDNYEQKTSSSDNNNQAGLELLYDFSTLLKRVALVYYPQTDVAKLTGQSWTQFLDMSHGSTEFTNGHGKALADGEYRPVFDADAAALHVLVRQWIKQQYLQKSGKQRTSIISSLNKSGVVST